MSSSDVPILVAAKAAPVIHETVDGDIVARLSVSTGSVIGDIASSLRITAVASAASAEDIVIARRHPDGLPVYTAGGQEIHIQLVRHSPETLSHERYGVVTEILWNTMHMLWGRCEGPNFDERSRKAWQSLHDLNDDIATALLDHSSAPGAAYLVHDYQLSLAPARIREADPAARILYFHHIVWPGPDSLALLPGQFVEDLLQGVLAADVVGFFAEQWARNFLRTVDDLVPHAKVDYAGSRVRVGDRLVRVAVAPLSYSSTALTALDRSWPADLAAWVGERPLVVHAGRTDPIKNAHRAVAAFSHAASHAARDEAVRDARMLVRINPHRLNIPVNAEYFDRVACAVATANARFGEERIRVLSGNDRSLTTGCLARADVVVINSLNDGQNLTAFEATEAGSRDPALIISPTCGASEVLGDDAVPVNPYDIVDQADALVTALTMTRDRRAAAAERRRSHGARYVLPTWTARQVELLDIEVPG